MRIALVCPYSFDLPGGVQNQVRGLANSLIRRGHGVAVLAPGTGSRRDGLDEQVELSLLGRNLSVPVNGSRAPIAPFPSVVRRTRRVLAKGEFSVVHVHEPFVPGPSLAALYSPARARVATFHRAGASRAYVALRPLLRPLVRRAGRIAVVSVEAERTLRAVLGDPGIALEVLYNGVDCDRFADARRQTRSQLTFLFLGRHEPRKGLEVFLEALTKLPDDVRVLVAGVGRDSDRLARQFGNDPRVEFLGRLSDDGVVEALSSSSVLVAPSLGGESFGVVLLEGMAAGLAVIASDLPGYRAAGGDAALYVAPGDPTALSEAMSLVGGDEVRRRDLVTAGRERAEAFSFDTLAERYESIYTEELASKSPARS